MKRSLGVDPALRALREKAKGAIVDYGFVMSVLSAYSQPRVKLNRLMKSGAVVRIKKGLYLLHEEISGEAVSKEIIANMIYGPSYVSLEWACQYYGLIPERVRVVTSVTTKRKKAFDTPLGRYTYDHLPLSGYAVGMTRMAIGKWHAWIATKEKAVVDLLVLKRGKCSSEKELKEILFEDFRMEETDLMQLDIKKLNAIYQKNPHSIVNWLIKWREKGE